ncbi:hypothetical protein VN97_g10578 [Penicillium thymicola]|uniref:Uncharacterized protein n=1 Tax=Penicillium thymicola TaxID=293382 RepID=A0AAI9T9L9_PENTH|nr:hypothetical protein VN97_g10578 [Penicillium thymicola]
MILLTIAALTLATGSRNKTYLGDQALSTYFEGASRPPTQRQVRLSRSSTCRTVSTPKTHAGADKAESVIVVLRPSTDRMKFKYKVRIKGIL